MRGTRNLFRRFLSLFSAKALSTVIAILSTPIIVRLLGAGDYGDYAVLLSVFSLYMIPISAAVTEGVQKFVGEDRDREGWSEEVIRLYLVLATVLVVAGAVLLVAVTTTGLPQSIFGDGFTAYFYLLAGFVFVAQFRAVGVRTVLGFGLEHISAPLNVTKKLVTVAFGIALVLAGYGVGGMLVGHIVANALVALIAGYVIVRRISVRRLFRAPDSFPYREILSFNAFNILLVLLVMSLYHVDIIMLRTLTDSTSTGYYKGALALAEYLWFVPLVLQSLLLHSSSSLWEDGRVGEITELAGRITRYVVLLIVLLGIGLATLADRVVPLYYGEPFVVAVDPLLLLIPGAIGYAAARPLQAISQGSGQIKTLVKAVAGAAGLNIALNALLIPQFGMNGAAVATSVGYGSMFVLLVWTARQIGFDPITDLRVGRIAVTALLSVPPILIADHLIEHDILALIVVPFVGLVTYSGGALATGAIDTGEVIQILEKFPGPIGNLVETRFS